MIFYIFLFVNLSVALFYLFFICLIISCCVRVILNSERSTWCVDHNGSDNHTLTGFKWNISKTGSRCRTMHESATR